MSEAASTLERPAPRITDDGLGEALRLVDQADSVELKLTVPDADRPATVKALGIDPLDAYLRQVFFFDTSDLALDRTGLVVRARRSQGRPDDSVVKLRPVEPGRLDPKLRGRDDFGVEVDALPGGFVASASMKGALGRGHVTEALDGSRPLRKLFSKAQRRFFAAHAPEGVDLDALAVLGPVTVLKLKWKPPGYGRKLVAELWFYPDGSRILELSTKCPPAEALDVAGRTRAFLAARGVDLGGPQQTKTRTALEYFTSGG